MDFARILEMLFFAGNGIAYSSLALRVVGPRLFWPFSGSGL